MDNQLQWETYRDIAKRFQHKAKAEDSEDLVSDIVLRLAEVEAGNGHKPFTLAGMLRTASYVVMEYWHDLKRQPTIFSLNCEIEDGDGDRMELYQTIADDRAIDLEAWLDARTWLLGCPQRLTAIAYRKVSGTPLSNADTIYLCKWRKKEQKTFV